MTNLLQTTAVILAGITFLVWSFQFIHDGENRNN